MRLAFAAIVILELVAVRAHADKRTAEARALYEKAITHYDLAEYDQAIAEFKQAYELTREPGLLFNIAQAYRLTKDYEQALHFYRTYLDLKPNAPNRADAEAQIAKMKEALQAAPPTPAPVAPPPPVAAPPEPTVAPTPAPVAAPPPPSSTRPRFVHSPRGHATIALAVVGGAALIAAAGTGFEALSIRSRYDAGCATGPCDGGLYSHGRTYAIATDALIGVGVVAAVAATVVGLVRPRERPVTLGMGF
jgi:tetratricopeptide (TPR) repeat protein